MSKSNPADRPSRRPDYVRRDDTPLLSTLQRKLEYERRLTEDNSHEMKKSENIFMKDVVESNSRSSISDDQSREIILTESHDHDKKEA